MPRYCRFLSENSGELGALASATVGDLGWAGRRVLSVSPDTSAFDAMLQMSQQNVSALAVVQDGKLIGALCPVHASVLAHTLHTHTHARWAASLEPFGPAGCFLI